MTDKTFTPVDLGGGDAQNLIHQEDAEFAASVGLDKTQPTSAPEPEGPPRDPATGKFVAKEAAPEAEAEAPAAEAETVEAAEPAESSEAEDPEAPKPEPKAPLTKFEVIDAAGNKVEAPDYKLTFKVDGKIVEHPLEKVVHLAQQSAYSSRQVNELNAGMQATQQQLMQASDVVAQYEQGIAKMFEDEALYAQARDNYLEANSPDKRAQAAEARAYQLQQQLYAQQESQQMAQFVEGTIQPAIQELARTYPSVTEDDIVARLALAATHFQQNGRVPLANMPKLSEFLSTELAGWAKAAHESRTAATREASKSLDKDRASAQAKQRQVGKALAPAGKATVPAAKTPPIKKASDVLNDPLFGGPQ